MSQPKNDLDVKVGTPEEAAWTMIRDNAKRAIDEGRRATEINKGIVELAEKRIAEEKQKLK